MLFCNLRSKHSKVTVGEFLKMNECFLNKDAVNFGLKNILICLRYDSNSGNNTLKFWQLLNGWKINFFLTLIVKNGLIVKMIINYVSEFLVGAFFNMIVYKQLHFRQTLLICYIILLKPEINENISMKIVFG